ncbi:hypothetical protein NL676_039441 [Syzygium grande]|nr:hypothetical protein NL676_039441 [Syzygium grande]
MTGKGTRGGYGDAPVTVARKGDWSTSLGGLFARIGATRQQIVKIGLTRNWRVLGLRRNGNSSMINRSNSRQLAGKHAKRIEICAAFLTNCWSRSGHARQQGPTKMLTSPIQACLTPPR